MEQQSYTRDLERYKTLLQVLKGGLIGRFTDEEKKVIVNACRGVEFEKPQDVETVLGHVTTVLSKKRHGYLVNAKFLIEKISDLSTAEYFALTDCLETYYLAEKGTTNVAPSSLFGAESPYPRRRIFAALHEAGHAFMMFHQGLGELLEVRIMPTRERGWYDAHGYYQGDVDQNHLVQVGGWAGHAQWVARNMMAGRVAQELFPDRLPLAYQDAAGAISDYIKIVIPYTQFTLEQGTGDRAAIHSNVKALIDDALEYDFTVFSAFSEALWSLAMELTAKTVLTGGEVAAILGEHGVPQLERKPG